MSQQPHPYQHPYTTAYDNSNGQQSKVQKVMNATIVTGEYFSKQENRNKKSYLTIGKLFIYQDGGMALKLDAMPMQNQSISFYDIKPKTQPNNGQNYNQPQQNYNNGSGGYQG